MSTRKARDGKELEALEELRIRLQEAEETIDAIRTGAVDAILVEADHTHRVYTLEGAERPYRMLVEHMQQGAATLSSNGVILYANAALADLVGVPLDDLIGAVLHDFVVPVERAAYRQLLQSGLEGGALGEVHLQAADGRPVPVRLSFSGLPPESGVAVGVLVTDMRESEGRYRTLVAQVKDYAIFRTDTEGRATTWNEGVNQVLGFDQDEFIGRDITTAIFTPEDVRSGVPQRELDRAAVDGASSNDRWMRRKDGTRFFALGVTTALRDPAGKLLGFTKVMRDQTVRKRLEEQLREVAGELSATNQRKDEFLAILAHELRNPLAPLQSSLEIIRDAGDDRATLERAQRIAGRQMEQMIRLVDDLVDVARISRDRLELRKERVDLAPLVRTAVETSRNAIETAGHQLSVALPTESIWLDADPARLVQVLGNLLNNASKYTGARGHIWLSAAPEGSEAVIRVRDDGIGIPPHMIGSVFDLFVQVDTALERAHGGLGIGLTLVKRIVELHGGTVEATSAGAGRGAEFVVRLPLAAPEHIEKGRAPDAVRPTAPRRKILVVDDNVDAAESLGLLLRAIGHDVRCAYSGAAALDEARGYKPQVVLLDIGMPDLSGYEVARLLTKNAGSERPHLIALTGWGQEEDRRRVREAGFDHHLVKPATIDMVTALLASL
jgi:PAS domain S-box-containing protein